MGEAFSAHGYCPACFDFIGVDSDGTIADHDHPDRGWAEIGCPGSGHPPLSKSEQKAVAEHYDAPMMFKPKLSLTPGAK